ncbi:DNA repair protein rhp54 [Plakobranchus ocellatus]|uniref:DNA repair protein rhp54 n=1 Tax=Plakobranchus ocellatus TaxID=259542 RepID=A0AAV4C764_9GAST|nr:DNA repair protein rhp54 [Plakobranchus ocellatus]
MYELYKEKCEEEGVPPVKLSYYRHIFNYSFNLEFHHRKTDRCDLCEKNKVAKAQGLLTEADEKEHSLHILNKEAMRKASEKDKQDQSIDVLVSFDLQNVISLPRADISSFFYKRKLNVYNLTGHLMDHRTSSKKGYCVIWPENLSGRAGNDIASAFIRMLEKITEERSDIKRITTWSDSCVPQNRNRIMSHAIHRFLHLHQNIDSITMKFSVPGHSCVHSGHNKGGTRLGSSDKINVMTIRGCHLDTDLGYHDFCLSWSHYYTDTEPTSGNPKWDLDHKPSA